MNFFQKDNRDWSIFFGVFSVIGLLGTIYYSQTSLLNGFLVGAITVVSAILCGVYRGEKIGSRDTLKMMLEAGVITEEKFAEWSQKVPM